jgi:hypothetical protein
MMRLVMPGEKVSFESVHDFVNAAPDVWSHHEVEVVLSPIAWDGLLADAAKLRMWDVSFKKPTENGPEARPDSLRIYGANGEIHIRPGGLTK